MDFNQGFGGMNQNFNMGMNNGFNMNNNGFEMAANRMGFNNNMNNCMGMDNMGNNNMNNGMFIGNNDNMGNMGNNCMNMNNCGMGNVMNNNGMFMGNNFMNMNNNNNICNMMNNNFGMNPCMNNNMNMMANILAIQLMQNCVNIQNAVFQRIQNLQQLNEVNNQNIQPQVQNQSQIQTQIQPIPQEDYKIRGFINLYFRQAENPTNPQLVTNDSKTPNSIMIQCHLNDKIADIIEKYRTKSSDREGKFFIFNAKKLILTLTAAESGLNDFSTIFVLKTKNVKGALFNIFL